VYSEGGAGVFVWLVTDALGRLGVVTTYGASTLLVAERWQSLALDGVELGGVYEPATSTAPNQFPPSPSSPSGGAPAQARQSPRNIPVHTQAHPTEETRPGTGSTGMNGSSGAPAALGRTLYYPLFRVSTHEYAWMAAGYGVWGMETYLERFWTCLDWAAVQDAYAQYVFRK
jgi:Fe-Mn family superoxide dismutase